MSKGSRVLLRATLNGKSIAMVACSLFLEDLRAWNYFRNCFGPFVFLFKGEDYFEALGSLSLSEFVQC
jgi:hypothetical protein